MTVGVQAKVEFGVNANASRKQCQNTLLQVNGEDNKVQLKNKTTTTYCVLNLVKNKKFPSKFK